MRSVIGSPVLTYGCQQFPRSISADVGNDPFPECFALTPANPDTARSSNSRWMVAAAALHRPRTDGDQTPDSSGDAANPAAR